MSHKH
jgi:spastin